MRKWLLSINSFLRGQNASIPDAIALWKMNVDQEFQGLEECLICYSIVHAQTGQLPRLKCHTCNRRFHGKGVLNLVYAIYDVLHAWCKVCSVGSGIPQATSLACSHFLQGSTIHSRITNFAVDMVSDVSCATQSRCLSLPLVSDEWQIDVSTLHKSVVDSVIVFD